MAGNEHVDRANQPPAPLEIFAELSVCPGSPEVEVSGWKLPKELAEARAVRSLALAVLDAKPQLPGGQHADDVAGRRMSRQPPDQRRAGALDQGDAGVGVEHE